MRSCSFEMTIMSGGSLLADRIVPDRVVLHTKVRMTPGTIRTEVFRPEAEEPFFRFVDDGSQIWEEAGERRVAHRERVTPGKRDLLLAPEIGLDGCLVGSVLSSWVGSEKSHIGYVGGRIRAGSTVAAVERGRPCWVSTSETGQHGPGMISTRHSLWIDQQTSELVRREVMQICYTKSGNILQTVKRTYIITASKR